MGEPSANMVRGPKKHLKQVNTPCYWYLNKLSGIFAPRPSSGPHKIRECIPMALLIREQLKYATTYKEVKQVLGKKLVKVDNKVRTDRKFPLGMMDVVQIPCSNESFRILVDVKGRYKPVRITDAEAAYKPLRVERVCGGVGNTPRVALTHDGRNISHVHKDVCHMDTLIFDLKEKEVKKVIKFQKGCCVMASSGSNKGRVGTLTAIKKHPGAVDLVDVEDANGSIFSTRLDYVFAIGDAMDAIVVTLPKGDGIKISNIEDRDQRIAQQDE